MKSRMVALLMTIAFPINTTPPNSTVPSMDDENNTPIIQELPVHQNGIGLPSCSDIIECIGCCCQAVFVIGYLSLRHKICKNTILEDAYRNNELERRME